jgi:colanic acid/amylovoran biosynthesis glycosyltransferase
MTRKAPSRQDTQGASVAHFVCPYLLRTTNWIHAQLVHLRRYRPIVITDSIANRELFPFEPVYAYAALSFVRKGYFHLSGRRPHDAINPFIEWVLRRERSIALHGHFGQAGVALLDVKQRTRLPMATAFYGADASELSRDPAWRGRYAELFGEGDIFLAEGPAMRQRLMALGCPKEKIVIQHLGVDLDGLPFVPRRPQSAGAIKILIAATFREKKGIPDALRAIDRLRRRYPKMTVTLLGDSGNKKGDEREKQLILSLLRELDGVVTWGGFVPPSAFRAALLEHHIFLSPSVTASTGDSEGGAPVSLIEAHATGMPIVSTHHDDIPEIVLDNETGLLSPERDVTALGENLARLIERVDDWERMGRAARTHIEKHYEIRTQMVRLEQIYSRMLSTGQSTGAASSSPLPAPGSDRVDPIVQPRGRLA